MPLFKFNFFLLCFFLCRKIIFNFVFSQTMGLLQTKPKQWKQSAKHCAKYKSYFILFYWIFCPAKKNIIWKLHTTHTDLYIRVAPFLAERWTENRLPFFNVSNEELFLIWRKKKWNEFFRRYSFMWNIESGFFFRKNNFR